VIGPDLEHPDAHTGNNDTSGASVRAGSITPTQDDDLVISIGYANSGSSDATPSGFTALSGQTDQAYAIYETPTRTPFRRRGANRPGGGRRQLQRSSRNKLSFMNQEGE
jgi:hypothetical protein